MIITQFLLMLAILINGLYAIGFALTGWLKQALICLALGCIALALLAYVRHTR